MRLFYAVNFEPAVKKRLIDIQDALRAQVVRGRFTHEDNLHLTLAFIGEVREDRSGPLRRIAEAFQGTPFEMRLSASDASDATAAISCGWASRRTRASCRFTTSCRGSSKTPALRLKSANSRRI
jgi:2'-5' RNA ligase